MKFRSLTLFFGLLFLTLFVFSPLLLAKTQSSKEDQFRELAKAAHAARMDQALAPAAGDGPPVVVAFVPSYHHIHHQDLITNINGTRLKSRAGDSRLGSVILTATKPINQYFTLGWIYQYTFGKYKGGLLVPDRPTLDGRSDLDLNSNMTGFFGDFNLGAGGRLNLSFFVAWDSFSGQETMLTPAGPDRRQVHKRDTRLGSITAWWYKDFPLSDSWALSPYLGWRTVRACIRGQTVWTAPDGTTATQNNWAHLASGGLTFKYKGPVNLKLWTGYNQRTKKGNVPGFASRAIAPGIANVGWMNNWDQGVWTYGLGVGRAIGDGFSFDLSYNGHYGKNTLSQAINLSLVKIF
ncbi:MAG: autotransporter outer membrane beta-barrel domain-containing protein [Deltaproteobacteria bacterium]|jgi:hypothetical protein|nr:autotransporter outer membrane beta-barrel domain-containing protein [Deltaproteobacteria bacterium]